MVTKPSWKERGKMLPKEPTKEMIQAAINRNHNPDEVVYATIWKAMYEAYYDAQS